MQGADLSGLSLKWLYSPPPRLRAVPDRWVPLLRLLWFFSLFLSVAAVALGTVYALREAYEIRPALAALSLDYNVEDDGHISMQVTSKGDATFTLVAINGTPASPDIRNGELAKRLNSAGPRVTLDLRSADGKSVRVVQQRTTAPPDPAAEKARDMRVAARLASGLLACSVLLICSVLLALRKPRDPVTMLFAFAFAGLASTIDPPFAMWMAYGWPLAYTLVSAGWFYLLLIALAVFPDGIFVPKFYRWLLIAAVPPAIFVSIQTSYPNLQAVVAFAALFGILAAQVGRYRRAGQGIERQQIKWAAFGFAAGLLLVALAVALLPFLPTDPNKPNMILNMAIMLLFSCGMAILPLGLLVALLRFRLWEADTVITRSAAYAVVTLIVGVVWAASSDLVKLIIEHVIGQESQAGATTAGAVIAAGIFSPTQDFVLGWTRKRFGGPLDRMRGASDRMKKWALTETPAEIATRALAIIDDVMHPSASAIVLDTALSRQLIAARNVSSADNPELIEKLNLADEESSVGTLLLGRRSDGNRYNRQQLDAVHQLIPSLAEALRVARSHHSRESEMQQRLDEMAARLAQLEAGAPKPA